MGNATNAAARLAELQRDRAEHAGRLVQLRAQRADLPPGRTAAAEKRKLREQIAELEADIADFDHHIAAVMPAVETEREDVAYAARCARHERAMALAGNAALWANSLDNLVRMVAEHVDVLDGLNNAVCDGVGMAHNGWLPSSRPFSDLVVANLIRLGAIDHELMPSQFRLGVSLLSDVRSVSWFACNLKDQAADRAPVPPAELRRREAARVAQQEKDLAAIVARQQELRRMESTGMPIPTPAPYIREAAPRAGGFAPDNEAEPLPELAEVLGEETFAGDVDDAARIAAAERAAEAEIAALPPSEPVDEGVVAAALARAKAETQERLGRVAKVARR